MLYIEHFNRRQHHLQYAVLRFNRSFASLTVCNIALNRNFISVHKKRDTTNITFIMWHIHATNVLQGIQRQPWVMQVLPGKEVDKENYP